MRWLAWIPLVGRIIENRQKTKQLELELQRLKLEHAKCPVNAPPHQH